MSELNTFQLWCKEILPVVQAAAEGEAIEYRDRDGVWRPYLSVGTPSLVVATTMYRIKPKTIKVNGFDVPAPMQKYPKEGSTYWIASPPHPNLCNDFEWARDNTDELYFSRGICHTTDISAIAHAKAMLGIDPDKE